MDARNFLEEGGRFTGSLPSQLSYTPHVLCIENFPCSGNYNLLQENTPAQLSEKKFAIQVIF